MGQERMKVLKQALTSADIGGSFGVGKIFTCDTKIAVELEKAVLARKCKDGEGEDDAPTAAIEVPTTAAPASPK